MGSFIRVILILILSHGVIDYPTAIRIGRKREDCRMIMSIVDLAPI